MAEKADSPESSNDATNNLLQVFAYVAVADEQVRDAVAADIFNNSPFYQKIIDHMFDEGLGVEDIVGLLGNTPRSQAVARRERELAEMQYGAALAEAGLKFDPSLRTTTVSISDLKVFGRALRRVRLPADPESAAMLARNLTDVIHGALMRVAHTIEAQNPRAYATACGDRFPEWMQRDELSSDLDPVNATDRSITKALPGQAANVARGFDDLGIKRESQILWQYQAADNERLTVEWAVAYSLGLLHGSAIGETRIVNHYEWSGVYSFLNHLQRTAPQSQFTRQVRHTLLQDIATALYDPTILTEEGESLHSIKALLLDAAKQVTKSLPPSSAPQPISSPNNIGEVIEVILETIATMNESQLAANGAREAVLQARQRLEGLLIPGSHSAQAILGLLEQAADNLNKAQEASGGAANGLGGYGGIDA